MRNLFPTGKLPLLTYAEAARIFPHSERQLRRAVASGRLKAVKLSSRVVRLKPSAICRFLRDCGF